MPKKVKEQKQERKPFHLFKGMLRLVATDFEKREELLGKLGKYKTEKESKDYLHIKNFEDIDLEVLKEIITNHSKLYPAN